LTARTHTVYELQVYQVDFNVMNILGDCRCKRSTQRLAVDRHPNDCPCVTLLEIGCQQNSSYTAIDSVIHTKTTIAR